jgi:hypothetical protein
MIYERKIEGVLFKYDADTGKIYRWFGITYVETGTTLHHGYRRVILHQKHYQAHRLAFYIAYGEWPKQVIDHINRIKDDNRLVNLRDVSISVNARNIAIPDKLLCRKCDLEIRVLTSHSNLCKPCYLEYARALHKKRKLNRYAAHKLRIKGGNNDN